MPARKIWTPLLLLGIFLLSVSGKTHADSMTPHAQPPQPHCPEPQACKPNRFVGSYLLYLPTLHSPPASTEPGSRFYALDLYQNQYLMENPPSPSWTGSHTTCDPGDTSPAFKDAILQRINYFRAMAGIPEISGFKTEYNQKAQAAALMMSVNWMLNHFPPTDWECYSASGAEGAGNSNLYLGVYGYEAIDGYIKDPGDFNYFVGHRRWILYPQTQMMGTGDIPPNFPDNLESNALWVFDDHIWDDRPTTRHEFIAWPPPGYVPYQVVYPRWSFAYDEAHLGNATVTMTSNGQTVPVNRHNVVDGFGENTLVWIPNNLNNGDDWERPDADSTYTVQISNVQIGGQSRTFTYEVTIFDPDTP